MARLIYLMASNLMNQGAKVDIDIESGGQVFRETKSFKNIDIMDDEVINWINETVASYNTAAEANNGKVQGT